MPSEPAQQAAAGVAVDLLAEVEDFTEPSDDAAEATEAVEAEVEQPQDELEIPEINWETPEELQDVLNAPDFEDDDDDESAFQQVEAEADDEYDDPEKAALKRQLLKAQKKLAWENEQRIKASRKSWAAEAQKYFQFSNPDIIDAKSRRAFLKEAQRQHEAVAKVAKPVFDQLAELKAKAKEEALAEARAEAEQRWGAPTSGPSQAATLEDTQTMQRQRLQHGQSLTNVIKAKLVKGQKDGNPLL